MEPVRIGVIGGSGLYQMEGLEVEEERWVDTPFGRPSDAVVIGRLDGVRVAFLSRHGRGHRRSPSEVNYRANIYALKALGVERILAVSAVGSLQEEYAPGHIVIPDQLVDRTKGIRPATFFGEGLVAHVAFAEPYCDGVREVLREAAEEAGAVVHFGGTYVCIEGPQFSTKAESNLYRSWGMDIIGMTALPEAKLAREAEICYATLAMVTDYDCWHPDHDSVTAEMVFRTLQENARRAQEVVRRAVARIAPRREGECPCATALQTALATDPRTVPLETRQRLDLLVGKYLS